MVKRRGKPGLPRSGVRGAVAKDLYPFESRWFRIGGRNYHYLDEGEGNAVVMVHGNPTWSFFYRDLVRGLSGKFRCLVPDHMGCGLSDKPQRYGYTLKRHIDNLEEWLESVLPPAGWSGGKISLVVHDWGGPIGLGYAVRHPERIDRVVILNTSAFLAGGMPRRIRLCGLPFLGSFLVRGLNLFALLAARMTTASPLPPRVRRAFVSPYNSWKNRVAVHAFVRDIPFGGRIPSHKAMAEIEAALPDLLAGKKMLIQWGRRDWCFTEFFLGEWRRRFPHAEADVYDAGHYLLEDEGRRIIPRIEKFLLEPGGAEPSGGDGP